MKNNVNDVISMTDNEAMRQPSWGRGQGRGRTFWPWGHVGLEDLTYLHINYIKPTNEMVLTL